MKNIKNYEGLYAVTEQGQVYNLQTKQFLKGGLDRYGYVRVTLTKDGVKKTHKVHRLVAEAYIPNPHDLPQVNHLDENKQNNCIENLQWVTAKENVNYGTRSKRAGENISKSLLNNEKLSKSIVCVETGVIYPSTREAERVTGIDHSAISKCCKGTRQTCGGYHWRFENEQ